MRLARLWHSDSAGTIENASTSKVIDENAPLKLGSVVACENNAAINISACVENGPVSVSSVNKMHKGHSVLITRSSETSYSTVLLYVVAVILLLYFIPYLAFFAGMCKGFIDLLMIGPRQMRDRVANTTESEAAESNRTVIEVSSSTVSQAVQSREGGTTNDTIQLVFEDGKLCTGYLREDGIISVMAPSNAGFGDDKREHAPPSYSSSGIVTSSPAAQDIEVEIAFTKRMRCRGYRQADGSVHVISGAIPPPPYNVDREA